MFFAACLIQRLENEEIMWKISEQTVKKTWNDKFNPLPSGSTAS